MSDTDLDDLAQRYLDLWQDQVSALAADPAFGEALRRLMEAGLGGGASAAWLGAGLAERLSEHFLGVASEAARDARAKDAAAGSDGGDRPRKAGDGGRSASASAAQGAAAAAAPSRHGDGDLDDVARRLAAMERRIAELERQLAARDGGLAEGRGGGGSAGGARGGAARGASRRRP